jgi:hypothetical protein
MTGTVAGQGTPPAAGEGEEEGLYMPMPLVLVPPPSLAQPSSALSKRDDHCRPTRALVHGWAPPTLPPHGVPSAPKGARALLRTYKVTDASSCKGGDYLSVDSLSWRSVPALPHACCGCAFRQRLCQNSILLRWRGGEGRAAAPANQQTCMQAAHHLATGSQRRRNDEAHWAVDPIIYRTECGASNGGDAMQGRQARHGWMDGLVGT